MTSKSAMFLVIAGLILAMGAVGGIEASVDNEQLLASMLLAILGLLSMYAGVLGLRGADYYDGR
jgi:lysylphosphatidylglycerol synthetase-like protein (DUF2156 family)